MKVKKGKRILALIMSALMVLTMMPMDWTATKVSAATNFTGGSKVESGTWKDWVWSTFGANASTEKNSIKEDDKGAITLVSSGNSGKIQGKQDGINYLYYELDTAKDFVITTKAALDSTGWANQNGFGIMLKAAVDTHGATGDGYSWNMLSIGPGMQSGANYAVRYKIGNGNKINTDFFNIGDMTAPEIGEVYDLRMEKIGDKVYVQINGEYIANTADGTDYFSIDKICPSTENTAAKMYVGIYNSRSHTAKFTDTHFSYAASDAIVAISDVTAPEKTLYYAGNSYANIDLKGFSAKVTIGEEERTITGDDVVVKSYDFDTVTEAEDGEERIVLSYLGEEIKLKVKVDPESITDMVIDYLPIKTEYAPGEAIDMTGFEARAIYISGVEVQLGDAVRAYLKAEAEYKAAADEYDAAGEDEAAKAAAQAKKDAAADAMDATNVIVHSTTDTMGTSVVMVKHEHMGFTAMLSFTIEVVEKEIASIEITEPNQTTFYKGVTPEAGSDKAGVLLTVRYTDGSYKIMSTGFDIEGTINTNETGTYQYTVSYGGLSKTYDLEVIENKPVSLKVDSIPDKTTYLVGEDLSLEGLKVSVVYNSEQTNVLKAEEYTTDTTAYNKAAAGTYSINVAATVDGVELSTAVKVTVREKIEYSYSDLEWKNVVFGQSTSKEKMTVTDSDDSVTIEAIEGAGKCTDDGQDGIVYHYITLDPNSENFEISAKVTVNYFITKSSPDNQEGFGIMVRDSINLAETSDIYCSNAVSIGGYYGRYNMFGRYGVTDANDAAARVNVNYNANKPGNTNYKIKEDAPKTFILTLKKDNSGIYGTMKNEDGSTVEKLDNYFFYLPADTFKSIESDKMYLGFMTARGAKITVDKSSVAMTVSSSVADAPQRFADVEPTTPALTLASITEIGSEAYVYRVINNVAGLMTVKLNGETIVNQESVEAGEYAVDVNLLYGDNKFQVIFEPDATGYISSASTVYMNTVVTRKTYDKVKNPIYVSPDGTKDGKGTKDSPLDVQTAITYVQPGQAIYAMGGTYELKQTTGIWKGNDGASEYTRKYLMADPERTEDVVFDFGGDFLSKIFVSDTFDVSGDYWYISDITFQNGGGVRVGGDNNILERCNFVGHSNSGLSISRTDGSSVKSEWPTDNAIINCNAWNNRDKSDNNADGFAAKLTCNTGNYFKGCIGAYNADDGWDLFSKGGTGAIGEVKVYDSIAFANGYYFLGDNAAEGESTIVKTKGDGNGFKMGGSGIKVMHEIHNSYSFGNRANGFTNNSDPWGKYIDCTGFNNGGSNLELHIYEYSKNDMQFEVENFKSIVSEGLKANVPDLSVTDTEGQSNCITPLKSETNFFYDAKKGVSSNSKGEVLTTGHFVNLSRFEEIMLGGVSAIKRDEDGNIDLEGFLEYQKAEGWVQSGDTWFYFKDNAPAKGWLQLGKTWYYLDETTGAMQTGWVKVAGKYYYMNKSGAMQTGWVQDGETWYYMNGSGVMQTGWVKVAGKYYYMNKSGAMQTGWVKDGKTWYYLDETTGAMQTGWVKVAGEYYYMNGSGAMQTGWVKSGKTWYYMNGSGVMQTGWVQVGKTWYYMNKSGAMCTGWLQSGDDFYYLKDSGAMATGKLTIKGVEYDFGKDGKWNIDSMI